MKCQNNRLCSPRGYLPDDKTAGNYCSQPRNSPHEPHVKPLPVIFKHLFVLTKHFIHKMLIACFRGAFSLICSSYSPAKVATGHANLSSKRLKLAEVSMPTIPYPNVF